MDKAFKDSFNSFFVIFGGGKLVDFQEYNGSEEGAVFNNDVVVVVVVVEEEVWCGSSKEESWCEEWSDGSIPFSSGYHPVLFSNSCKKERSEREHEVYIRRRKRDK